jgi:glycerophosphoryl diester phosphodiesterase
MIDKRIIKFQKQQWFSLFIIHCSLFICSCNNLNNLNQNKTFGFDVQAHRGGRGWMPENTIPAMLHAVDLGVTTLEMDAVITKDSQVIVSHEPFFNHDITTKPDGSTVNSTEEKSLNIYNMNYDEVKRYDVGMKPHPRFPDQQKLAVAKPLLSNLIDSVELYVASKKRKPVSYNIEIKSQPLTDNIFHPATEKFVDLVVQVITQKKIESRTVIQSFDRRPLQHLHRRYSQFQLALLIEENDTIPYAKQLQELGFIPTIYSPAYKLVTPLLVKQCADMNVRLIPWTVNTKEEFQRLKSLGVNGIITDYPPAGK